MTPYRHANGTPGVRAALGISLVAVFLLFDVPASRAAGRPTEAPRAADSVATRAAPALPLEQYTGRDSVTGIPRYIARAFTPGESVALRARFGIDEPARLYRSDDGFLVYDSEADRGLRHFVNTYRVGGMSARLPNESYAEFEARIRGKPASYFGPDARRVEQRLSQLAPDVEPAFRELIEGARQLGLAVAVVETYRSVERQAYLLSRGGGLTFTGTSMHADRRAVDFRVGDGNLRSPRTRAAYVAFRTLASERGFELQGDWDPGHVALVDPEAQPGFATIEELLAAAIGERVATGRGADHRASRDTRAVAP